MVWLDALQQGEGGRRAQPGRSEDPQTILALFTIFQNVGPSPWGHDT